MKIQEFGGKTWVTRPRPHIDRIATAWLIRRFIDAKAEFIFAYKYEEIKEGIPFDYPGVEFGHQGDDCTFETFLKRFDLKDAALKPVAEIVHDIDLKDDKFSRNEAGGVNAIIKGLAELIADDHTLIAQGFFVFDALYKGFGGVIRTEADKNI